MVGLLVFFLALNVHAAEPATNVQDDIDLSALSDGTATPEAVLKDEFKPASAAAANVAAATTPTDVSVPGQITEASKNLKESEIPVFPEIKKSKEGSVDSPIRKMVLSLALILASIIGVGYFLRRWLIQKKTQLPNAQIKIITQQYLGPRKSLAIIYVAGESLLVGITDHNIQLIKQLSLIDDELPQELPKKFDESLNFIENTEPESGENFSMRGLKEIVTSRLKNMREI